MSGDDLTPISVIVHHESEKAFLVTATEEENKDDGDWLPKSQLKNVERNGNILNADLPEWLAEKKGLI